MDSSLSSDPEAKMPSSNSQKKGNWVTFPFILGAMAGLALAGGGWIFNLIVYLIEEFSVKSIDAAQIYNVFNGGTNLIPFIGAIVADSFLGSFSVITISSCLSLLGLIILTLTALVDGLKPKPCEVGSSSCQAPLKFQYGILYAGLVLACIGSGGSRFTMATMGANQFEKIEERGIFFNWFFFTLYICAVISSTGIVYIQDNVNWGLGFGICAAANLIGLLIFLLGSHFYRCDKPQGSPFTILARVAVAAMKKKNIPLSSRIEDYYYCHNDPKSKDLSPLIANSFRFFNRAAIKTEGDVKADGSIAKPWRLCTLQQVEDFKTVIRIVPIWSSSILLSTQIAVQSSLTVLQALAMDRHLGQHFKIPASSILVLALISTSIFLTFVDPFFNHLWIKLKRKSPSPLQRIGVGHVLTVISMAVSALVESRRLWVEKASPAVPMLALWLFPQLILTGIGEAFHFPGQVALYYEEFPGLLRSTATAMISLIMGISFYLSTALIDLVRRITDWLPDDINHGRLDNMYWVLVVLGVINFGYFLCCAKFYKYQNVEAASSSGSDG